MRQSRSEYRANIESFACARVAPSYHNAATQSRGATRVVLALAVLILSFYFLGV